MCIHSYTKAVGKEPSHVIRKIEALTAGFFWTALVCSVSVTCFSFPSPPAIWIRLFICSLPGYKISFCFSSFPINLSLLQCIQWASFTITFTLKPFSRFSSPSESLPAILLHSHSSSLWCTYISLGPLARLSSFPNNPGFLSDFCLIYTGLPCLNHFFSIPTGKMLILLF